MVGILTYIYIKIQRDKLPTVFNVTKNELSRQFIYMKKITEQKDVFVLKLQSLYDIEKELEKALPKMAKMASDQELVDGFNAHLEVTKEHAKRLEQIFDMIGEAPAKVKSESIRGIEEDTNWITKTNSSSSLKDTMIASAARNAEHLEMAGYMSAILEAKQLGLTQAEEILNENLKDEQFADKKLEEAMQKNFQNEPII
jgi:ferritin-like metal-binding protein YciE